MSVPKLRFSQFSDSWRLKTIDVLAEVTTGNRDTQNKVDCGKYPFFVRSQTVEKIDSYSYDGEAILTSGDGVGVGKNFHYINGKFDFHQRVYCIRKFKADVAGKYLFQYFAEKFNQRVMKLSAKNSVDSVRREMITAMPVHIPSLAEQTKIANFLTAVDEKITQLTQKYDLLKQYKKGVMQQVFSQELRFKDDEGKDFPAWESSTLIDLSENGFTNGVFNDSNKVGRGYKLINVLDMYIDSTIDESRLSLLELSDEEFIKNKVENGDIFFTRSSLVKDGIAYSNVYLGCSQNITFDGHLIRMRPNKEKLDSTFTNYLLRTSPVRKQLVERGKTATMTTIGQADIAAVVVQFPCLAEQTRIANFLTAIDAKITNAQSQIASANLYKQGLLQQMFV